MLLQISNGGLCLCSKWCLCFKLKLKLKLLQQWQQQKMVYMLTVSLFHQYQQKILILELKKSNFSFIQDCPALFYASSVNIFLSFSLVFCTHGFCCTREELLLHAYSLSAGERSEKRLSAASHLFLHFLPCLATHLNQFLHGLVDFQLWDLWNPIENVDQ